MFLKEIILIFLISVDIVIYKRNTVGVKRNPFNV